MADVAEAPLYRARPYLTAAAAATAVAAAYGTASMSVPAAKHYLALSAKLPRKRTVTPANNSGVGTILGPQSHRHGFLPKALCVLNQVI